MDSGQARAGNSDKLSDTGRARAWASRARVGLGPKFEARVGLYLKKIKGSFINYYLGLVIILNNLIILIVVLEIVCTSVTFLYFCLGSISVFYLVLVFVILVL